VRRGITADKADLIGASLPYRLWPQAHTSVTEKMQRDDAEFYDRLRAVGFRLDFGDDGTGLGLKYHRRGSGYYIDVGGSALIARGGCGFFCGGGSDLIASGDIGLRSGVDLAEIRERSVVLSNGEELPADLIVYAAGYG